MKLNKEKRDQLILALLATGVLTVGCWFALVETRGVQLQRAREALTKARRKSEDAERFLQSSASIATELAQLSEVLAEKERGMALATEDLYTWSYGLMMAAKEGSRVAVQDVTRPEDEKLGVFATFPYTTKVFTVRGAARFQDLGLFLAEFENTHPYFRVQNIQLAAQGDSGGDRPLSETVRPVDQLNFRMEVVALVRSGS